MPTLINHNKSLTLVNLFQELTPISTEIIANKKEKKKISDLILDALGLSANYVKKDDIKKDQIESMDEELYKNIKQENQLEKNKQEKKTT
ncbi:10365_t:CDS:1, partial [Cetraspora pellucida]